MRMQRWTPGSALRSELGRLFDGSFPFPGAWLSEGFERPIVPATLDENDEAVTVRFELPGVDPERIQIELLGDVLTLSLVERKAAEGAEGTEGAARTDRFRSFKQSFSLPFAVESDQVSAETRHGVLTITLPKAQAARPKLITVQATE